VYHFTIYTEQMNLQACSNVVPITNKICNWYIVFKLGRKQV